jgi:LPXTG-motif cell wall-anchored protein
MKRGLAVAAAVFAMLGSWAAPALAAPAADIRVTIEGPTISVGSFAKAVTLSISNAGPGDAYDVVATVDFSALDPALAVFDTAQCIELTPTFCSFPVGTVAAGAELDYTLTVSNAGGGTGPAGTLAAFANHAGVDPVPGNNGAVAEVTVAEAGVDLAVAAPDVYHWTLTEGLGEGTTPVPPGGASAALAVVFNYGAKTAQGLTVEIVVPAHVTLTGPGPTGTCEIAADRRSATCSYPDEVVTGVTGTDPTILAWPIAVSEEAPGPIALTGGMVTVDAIAEVDPPATVLARGAAQVRDVDNTDNVDGFAVFVAGPASPPPPNGGGGGGLPVTGPMAGGLAAAGAGLLLLGSALVLLARRRRLVVKP